MADGCLPKTRVGVLGSGEVGRRLAAGFRSRGHDVVITPNKPFGNKHVPISPITEQTLAQVRGTEGVAEASGSWASSPIRSWRQVAR